MSLQDGHTPAWETDVATSKKGRPCLHNAERMQEHLNRSHAVLVTTGRIPGLACPSGHLTFHSRGGLGLTFEGLLPRLEAACRPAALQREASSGLWARACSPAEVGQL